VVFKDFQGTDISKEGQTNGAGNFCLESTPPVNERTISWRSRCSAEMRLRLDGEGLPGRYRCVQAGPDGNKKAYGGLASATGAISGRMYLAGYADDFSAIELVAF
jgi:hypothetical protein